jgi:8-oxo-dGTP pyrophosphatase MutT (NUDIX family)/ribosomal protein S18 acetylase RimI-like enzyme
MTILVSNDNFSIHEIRSDDLESVLAIYQESEDFLALGPEPHASMVMVQEDIKSSHQDSELYCGIYDSGLRMVGVVSFIPWNFGGRKKYAYFSLLMIAQPFRKQKIGSQIVSLIEEEVHRKYQVTLIGTSVQVNNPKALKFWNKNGYQISSGPELQSDQTTVFHLQKELGGSNALHNSDGNSLLNRHTRYRGAIVKDHHILLIKVCEYEKNRVFWMLPGGGLEPGETEEECVQREMKEETNLDVHAKEVLFAEDFPAGYAYKDQKTYLCDVLNGEAKPGSEPEFLPGQGFGIVDIGWFNLRNPDSWGLSVLNDSITCHDLSIIREKLGYLT